ncbi:MAG: aspartate/glutamate racemase family protein, partial [Sneathiella sp.]|nr:aspartate/glutamate racemase family protein [Sneathiella sp.]
KIVNMTDNGKSGDQGHASVVHLSMSQFIKDRTAFIYDKIEPNPGTVMGDLVRMTCKAYQGLGGNFVVGVPCNTFHSPIVYNAYQERLVYPNIQSINMIDCTAKYLNDKFPGKKIILLSTRGTRETGVYHDYCKGKNFAFIPCHAEEKIKNKDGSVTFIPREIDTSSAEDHTLSFFMNSVGDALDPKKIAANPQGAVMASIYGRDNGIKSVTGDWKINLDVFEMVINSIIWEHGGEKKDYCVIMGCTEIPLAYEKAFKRGDATTLDRGSYIDPMDILAANMIVQSKYKLKDSYEGFVVEQAAGRKNPFPRAML